MPPVPSVTIKKQDGQTGVVPPSPDGILCIIAPAEKGPSYAAAYARPDSLHTDYGEGMMSEDGAYVLDGGKSIVVVRPVPSTPGAYGSVTTTRVGTSTSAMTTHGATVPLDDFACKVSIVAGGTIGVDGIEYKLSIGTSGGNTDWGPVRRLGTDNFIVFTDARGFACGVRVDFAAGTLDAGDLFEFSTTGPRMTNADLVAALEALRVAQIPYEGILVHGLDADSTTASALDSWLSAREAEGKFKFFIASTRLKGPSESESAYRNAMQTVAQNMSSIRGSVATDGSYLASPLRGVQLSRATAVALARRLMAIDPSVDAARVSDGVLSGVQISDARGNQLYHDELLSPGLDDLRLVALRSFADRNGVFINNPNVISPVGSDYTLLQYVRVMNRACARTFFLLEGLLSEGVVSDPATGFILEADAAHFEELINDDLDRSIKRPKQVSAIVFELSRQDDLSSNAGATLTGTVSLIGLKYVKKFSINARYVRTLGG